MVKVSRRTLCLCCYSCQYFFVALGESINSEFIIQREVGRSSYINIELRVPTVIFRYKHGMALVLELVSGYVDDKSIPFKPRMGMTFTKAAYVLKLTAFILLQVLREKERCVTTSPVWEFLKGNYKCFRITLYDCGAKASGKLYQFVFIAVDHNLLLKLHYHAIKKSISSLIFR
jgi:hypothetical protein